MRFSLVTLLATALAGFGAAQDWTEPKGDSPIGNPFKTPELNSQVPKGKPYEVTWTPTIDKAGTITILLLRGPSENAVPQYAIAKNIPNDGKFMWTPSEDLKSDKTHYGLQLIVDATGQYQYTPQFGISGDDSSASSSSYPSYPSETKTKSRPAEPSKATSIPAEYSTATAVPPAPSATKSKPAYPTVPQVTTSYGTAPTGTGAPTPSAPAPSVPAGTSAGSAPPAQTTVAANAAGKTLVASGAAIFVAIAALAF